MINNILKQVFVADISLENPVSFLPGSVWGMATGLSLILVLLACGIYLWYRNRIKAAVKDSENVADLAAHKIQLESEIEQCVQWLNNNREELLKLDAERQEQERLRQELVTLQVQTAEEQQKVNDLSKETGDLQHVVSALAQDRDKIDEQLKKIAAEKEEAEKARSEMWGILDRYKTEKNKLDEVLRNLAEREIKQQSLIGEISAREAQLEQTKSELEEVQEKLAKARVDLAPLKEVLEEKERVRQDRDRFIKEKEEVQRETDILQERVKDLRKEAGSGIDRADRYSDLFNTEPKCFHADMFPGGSFGEVDEREALSRLQDSLKKQGLIFSERTIRAFHTSLKISEINPLLVLAGVSGTGKTLLPIKYAEAMGMHNLVVSVQPRWDSPQDLFGFYNYLEHKYKAMDLSRALILMDPYNFAELESRKKSDRMLLVLLDEMNLARVEYYFSEFLSKLELRRGVRDKTKQADRGLAEIELDTGPKNIAKEGSRIWVDKNVLFVGTMNEDESTQTLSAKVLDRANVIRFGKPPEGISAALNPQMIKCEKFLPFSQWNKWIKPVSDASKWHKDIKEWIKDVNRALEQIGRPFGHRVQQAMHEYVANYPGIGGGGTHKVAFADQIEQKVMPKLRGIDPQDQNAGETLDKICDLIEKLGDSELRAAFSNSRDDKSTGTFVWRGVTRKPE